MKLKVETE